MATNSAQMAPSTTQAAAAQAQSREAASLPHASPQTQSKLPAEHFTIGLGVTRTSHAAPYQRKPNDPLYRPLRIFTRDPAASLLQGSVSSINIPYEPLGPGPEGKLLEVDPGPGHSSLDLDDPSILISGGLAPSVADERFHSQMVYAVCSSVYASFRTALGRNISWGFDRKPGEECARLIVRPHASEVKNAFYQKEDGTLNFGFYRGDKSNVIGNNLPGGIFYTCLSHDIVAHEMTHALLDGLRSNFTFPSGPDVPAFHEAFADLVALFQRFSYEGVVRAAIRQAGPKLGSSEILTGIAQQFGETTLRQSALRDAFDLDDKGQPKRSYGQDLEVHAHGSVLVSAVFEAFTTVFARKVAPYLKLTRRGETAVEELPSELVDLLASSASKLAGQFLSLLIRAIDYCPPVNITFGDYLRAIITADRDLVPDDPYAYREAFVDAFRRRAIFPNSIESLSEDSLIWGRPRVVIPNIDRLNFANLRFEGDPQNAAGPEELRAQASALGSVICQEPYIGEFGLVGHEDAAARGLLVEPPSIQSIRSSRRVGPNGQVIFDLIAEVTQRQMLLIEGRRILFIGGSTVILGPDGDIRYVISKSLRHESTVQNQVAFLATDVGRNLWERTQMGIVQRCNIFQLIHENSADGYGTD